MCPIDCFHVNLHTMTLVVAFLIFPPSFQTPSIHAAEKTHSSLAQLFFRAAMRMAPFGSLAITTQCSYHSRRATSPTGAFALCRDRDMLGTYCGGRFSISATAGVASNNTMICPGLPITLLSCNSLCAARLPFFPASALPNCPRTVRNCQHAPRN